jgi:uncharacterized RDD family membrane protein YckC
MERDNPFVPPGEDPVFATEEEAGYLQSATIGQRMLNSLVDFFAFVLLSAVAGFIFGLLGARTGHLRHDGGVRNVVGYGAFILYYVVSEGTTQRTLGKWFTRTKVVADDGRKPSLGQIIGRSVARLVPFEPFSCFSSRGGWHDRWSRTRVVRLLK